MMPGSHLPNLWTVVLRFPSRMMNITMTFTGCPGGRSDLLISDLSISTDKPVQPSTSNLNHIKLIGEI